MLEIWFYTLLSILVVSLISLIGVFTISIKAHKIKKFLIYSIAFSTGALFGDAFLHLLPEIIEESGFTVYSSLFILSGIGIFFFVEKIVHWQHCHHPISGTHKHTFATMNLIGDGVHNFLDGIIVGVSYLVSIPVGIATTIAVALHEIPQEIGDFGVMLHGGLSKRKALLLNFIVSLTAFIGAITALLLANYIGNIQFILVPIAIGGFIYIAGADLIPELHKQFTIRSSLLQLLMFALGIAFMLLLLLLE